MPSERAKMFRADGSGGARGSGGRERSQGGARASEEPVRAVERGRVLATHVPLVRQDLERAQRVRLAEPFVPSAVDDLEQLHRELDVADASPAALDLDVGLAGGADVLLEADLDASDLVDRRFGEHLGEHERGHGLHERVPEPGFARDGPGFDQRLALPGRGLRSISPSIRARSTSSSLDYQIDDRCRMLRGAARPLARALHELVHVPHLQARRHDRARRRPGPGRRRWTDLDNISPFMIAAVLTTEDGAFYKHKGFNHAAIRTSVAGEPEGASLRARREHDHDAAREEPLPRRARRRSRGRSKR